MPTFKFTSPDGKQYSVNGPEGATQDQAFQMLQTQLGSAPKAPAEEKSASMFDSIKGAVKDRAADLGNSVAGAVRGAGSIGATILAPIDVVKDALAGKGLSLESNRERRAAIDEGLKSMGADPESWAYQGGKLATEIAGTAGVGGGLASVAGKVLPAAVTATPAANALITAAKTGGFSVGGAPVNALTNIGARAVGGGINGAASTFAINPADTGTGAAFGAALPVAGKAIGAAGSKFGSGLATAIGELGTHTGGQSIKNAFNAGVQGGEKAEQFAANMRGDVPMEDVLSTAKDALQNMRIAKGQQYREGMAGVTNDKTVLDFAPIEQAAKDIADIGTFKGKAINRSTADTQQKITDVINEWKNEAPAEFHTVEGFDALKKTIGDIRDSTPFGTPSRVAADRAYNAVKKQITEQAPDYANVMKDYETASGLVKEIEKSLSLGNKASADTAMRKLQSLTRNNVSTNYGNRVELAQQLEANGAGNLLSNLSAQSLNTWAPRGLGKVVAGGAAVGGALAGSGLTVPILATQSPRLMGEAAFGLGKIGGAAKAGGQSVNALAEKMGVSPAVLMNYLNQSN